MVPFTANTFRILATVAIFLAAVSGTDANDRFLKYGEEIFLQNNFMNARWMSGGRGGGNEGVNVDNQRKSDYEISVKQAYDWKIRSTPSGDDPKSGECVKYGDRIFLQVYSSRWLSGARGGGNEGVITRDYFKDSYEQTTVAKTYQWIVRSNAGIGSRSNSGGSADPAFGECVEEFSLVFLQSNFMDNRWLSGSRSGGNTDVIVRNMLRDTYEQTTVAKTYQWILKRNIGTADRSESLQCAAVSATGNWVPIKYSNGMQVVKFTEGVERSSSSSFQRTKSWEVSVTASITAGFGFGEAGLEVSASVGGEYTSIVEESITKTASEEFTTSFGPGQVWQFVYTVRDLCESGWDLVTADLVITKGREEPPCCLPGYALDRQHGPCAEGMPCSCSAEVCSGEVDTECGDTGTRNLRG